jgi:Fe-S cluster assembly protein SufD
MSVTALSAEPLLRRFTPPTGEPATVATARARARERFLRHGLPHRRVEAWKYTDLKPLQTLDPEPTLRLKGDSVLHFAKTVVVFVEGVFRPELSHLDPVDGLSISQLAAGGTGVAELFDDGDSPADAMAALNGAVARDGAVIRVAPGVRIEEPVQIVSVGGVVRHAIILGEGASLTLLNTVVGGEPFASAVTRAVLARGAALVHAKVTGGEDWHIDRTTADVAAGASFHDLSLSIGGTTVRQEVLVKLGGKGASCRLNGINLGRDTQHHDYWSQIAHDAPGCTSDQNFRAVVEGRAVSVFQGRIAVAVDAQRTDARQLSRNLLLSDHAVAYTKPELEILADDVKCSHGATVGDLSAQELFYLRSRGIGADEARRLLVTAFVAEAFDGMDETVRPAFDAALDAWLGGAA